MDMKEIKNLVKLVETANISHLSVEEKGLKIEIKKEAPAIQTMTTAIPQVQTVSLPAQHAEQPATQDAAPEKTRDPNLVPITAQMVGTYYAASNPEAAPYVKVGDNISKGQVVCIIEAMKLCNEIESEISGTIEEICVNNAEPIEFGQELFLIRVS